MKYSFILTSLFLLAILACGEAVPTSTPQISTAAPAGEERPTEDTNSAAAAETAPPVDTPAPTGEPPTEEPAVTSTPEPATANLGDLVEQGGYSFAAVTLEDPATPGLIYSPTEGMKLVAVEVIVGNVSGERITVNPLDATMLDADGFTYVAELAGRDGQLILVDLEPGQRVRGWIAFEIPDDSVPSVIKYNFSSFPDVTAQSRLETETGEIVFSGNVPLSGAGDVTREAPAGLGEVVQEEGYSFTVEMLEDPAPAGLLYSPNPGTRLVAVQIVVGNESGEVITTNPLDTILVDTEGFLYEAELGGRDGQLELVDLAPGELVRGWVAFEIPEDAVPASVRFQVSGFPLIELQAGVNEG